MVVESKNKKEEPKTASPGKELLENIHVEAGLQEDIVSIDNNSHLF